MLGMPLVASAGQLPSPFSDRCKMRQPRREYQKKKCRENEEMNGPPASREYDP